jgi:hypothetical protein
MCGGKKRNAFKLLIGNNEWKKPLGKPTHRRKDNIKIDLGETE